MASALYDSHCHLDFTAFDDDREAVLARAHEAGVREILVPGVDPAGWARAAALETSTLVALKFALGLHPWALEGLEASEVSAALDALVRRLDRSAAVGVGELGYDRPLAKRGGPSLERQAEVADIQIELARARSLPIILHVVGCPGFALERLRRHGVFLAGGVVHGYAGPAELVESWLALGLDLSFGPLITRPKARRAREAARAVPLERLLVETDAPDQRPGGRGEPADVRAVLERLAELRGEPFDSLAEATRARARGLFDR